MADDPIKILGIPGSLRKHSYNRALIKAAQEVAPAGMQIELYLLHDIPLYDADVEAQGNPEPVQQFKDAIASADGLLFATPQYNRSLSGVLKNAIDWASRPAFESVLVDKPCALLGATSGQSATAVAREDLTKILDACRALVMPEHQIGLTKSGDHIDKGYVHSQEVRNEVRFILEQFVAFIHDSANREAAA